MEYFYGLLILHFVYPVNSVVQFLIWSEKQCGSNEASRSGSTLFFKERVFTFEKSYAHSQIWYKDTNHSTNKQF